MIAIFDIDGVLADASHRQHLVQSRPKDWAGFFAAVGEDEVIERGRTLLLAHQAEHEVVLVSGRPESTRVATREWLEHAGIHVERLVLRREADYRPAAVAKAELVQALAGSDDVAVIVDDDETVVDMLTGLGYPARLFR